MNLYITADRIGIQSGGGLVTANELLAMKSLGPVQAVSIDSPLADPFAQDQEILQKVKNLANSYFANDFKRVHCYAGCLTETIKFLKETFHTKVTYTAAAHNIDLSRQEHEKLGIPFNYPHLTDPGLWAKYVAGYLSADVVICPSQHSKACMESYGCKQVTVIPHGVDLPDVVQPLPKQFVVGYLGAYGPDKGIIYLLQAWKRLASKDGILILAGQHSTSEFVQMLVSQYGGGNIHLMGWATDIADFYKAIFLYVQPSVSEGFGCEVLEAMAHGRPVICSDGAGAFDIVPKNPFGYGGYEFKARDVDQLWNKIADFTVDQDGDLEAAGQLCRQEAQNYTWDKIRRRYVELWRSL